MKNISFEALKDLENNRTGLSDKEVISQRLKYGDNKIVEAINHPWLDLVKDTLKDPMIWFLLIIGIIFYFVGDKAEAFTLLIAILPLIFMDAFLNWRTQTQTAGLKGQLASRVNVLRNSLEVEIDSVELVPGDLIILKSGELLSADGFFQDIKDVQVDESVLTGESFPINKKNLEIDPFKESGLEEVSVDTEVLGFAGTRILMGEGYLRVLLTGTKTSYGEIIQSVLDMPKDRTPLQKSITNLVKWLIIVSGLFCLLLAGTRIYQGHGWLDAILSAATLAIAAIPEEFPVVFTYFLGVGVYRLAKKHALVRRAVSVENIGRITYICTDKTGTITSGILTLTHLDPINKITEEDLLEAGLFASNPTASDPVDKGIQVQAGSKDIKPIKYLQRFPFTEDRKRESVIVLRDNLHITYMKGSPEMILKLSTLNENEKDLWRNKINQWAQEGHKVLAVSKKTMSKSESEQNLEPESGFEFYGLLAFEDPARPEVAPSIEYCKKNGIRVMMITGDHPMTASAIAKDVGLSDQLTRVISAEDNNEKFQEKYFKDNPSFLKELDVITRCTPLQKLKIVNALKNSGELVAVTGDGVNDVPALKAADIGIAMGKRGTRSAKEVSSIILADDNFNTIVNAIMEGRQLFSNLKMSFEYLLLFHIPFVITAALIPLFDYPIVYLPIHIVWLELVIHPTALFAFQKEASTIDRAPQINKAFFTKSRTVFVLIVGILLALTIGFIFQNNYDVTSNIDFTRSKSMGILMLWSAALILHFTHLNNRSAIIIFSSTIAGAILIIQTSFFANYLHTSALSLSDWITIFFICACFLTALNLEKLYIKIALKMKNK